MNPLGCIWFMGTVKQDDFGCASPIVFQYIRGLLHYDESKVEIVGLAAHLYDNRNIRFCIVCSSVRA